MKWDQLREIAQAVGSFVALALAGFLGWWGKNRHTQTQAGTSIAPPTPSGIEVVCQQMSEVLKLVKDIHRADIIEEQDGTRRIAARESTNQILAGLRDTAAAIHRHSEVLAEDSKRRTGMVEELAALHRQIDRRMTEVEARTASLKDDTAAILLHLRKGLASG